MPVKHFVSSLQFFTLCALLAIASSGCSEQSTAQSDGAQGEGAEQERPVRDNSEPRVSPNAMVSQNIGTTVVTISYGRPGVKGRTIFGDLEAYGEVWRAGANEATVISFSDDVTINGVALPAGHYAFFVIPTEQAWTLIFNRTAEQWGAFSYNEGDDALRVTVQPEEAPLRESLMYFFEDLQENSARAVLHWSTIRVSFTIGVD